MATDKRRPITRPPAVAVPSTSAQEPPTGAQPITATTTRSGPSREIAAAFGTARSNVIAAGTRRTRSASGALPPGSQNYQRSLRHQQTNCQQATSQEQPNRPQANMQQQENRHQADQEQDATEPPSDAPIGEQEVRRICEVENRNLDQRVNQLGELLQDRLDGPDNS